MKLSKARAVLDGSIDFCAMISGVILAAVTLIISAEVVMRYFVGRSIFWEFEVTQISMVYMTFLPAAWLLKKEGHVILDLVLNGLSPKPKALVNSVTSIISALVCLILTWYGASVTWDLFSKGIREATILQPPSFTLYIAIPIGGLLLFIQFLRRAYKYLGHWRSLSDQRA